MLKVEKISSGYGKKQVLYDVSLEIKQGEIILLTGGNGSGKSTLLKCIYNLLPLWKGEIYFEGDRIDQLKPSDLIKKGIIYIPQKDFCFENLTVDENLQIAGNIYDKKKLQDRLQYVYDLTGLIKLKDRKPFYLSGGEKKLLGFGMSLVHLPKLILFDEPLAGVDKTTTDKIMNNLSKLKNELISMLIIEHKKTSIALANNEFEMQLGTKLQDKKEQ